MIKRVSYNMIQSFKKNKQMFLSLRMEVMNSDLGNFRVRFIMFYKPITLFSMNL
jgi:hypothetical protein